VYRDTRHIPGLGSAHPSTCRYEIQGISCVHIKRVGFSTDEACELAASLLVLMRSFLCCFAYLSQQRKRNTPWGAQVVVQRSRCVCGPLAERLLAAMDGSQTARCGLDQTVQSSIRKLHLPTDLIWVRPSSAADASAIQYPGRMKLRAPPTGFAPVPYIHLFIPGLVQSSRALPGQIRRPPRTQMQITKRSACIAPLCISRQLVLLDAKSARLRLKQINSKRCTGVRVVYRSERPCP